MIHYRPWHQHPVQWNLAPATILPSEHVSTSMRLSDGWSWGVKYSIHGTVAILMTWGDNDERTSTLVVVETYKVGGSMPNVCSSTWWMQQAQCTLENKLLSLQASADKKNMFSIVKSLSGKPSPSYPENGSTIDCCWNLPWSTCCQTAHHTTTWNTLLLSCRLTPLHR